MIEEFFEKHGAVQDIQLQYVCYGKNAAEPHHGAVAGEMLHEVMLFFSICGHYQ